MSAATDSGAAGLAALIVANAVQRSPMAALSDEEKAPIIRRGVALMLAAGAYIQGGALFLPKGTSHGG